jgi:hypothetical protein
MGRGLGLLVGNKTVTMLSLARILGLILMGLRGTRTAALQHDTIMFRTTAVAQAITHRVILSSQGFRVKS